MGRRSLKLVAPLVVALLSPMGVLPSTAAAAGAESEGALPYAVLSTKVNKKTVDVSTERLVVTGTVRPRKPNLFIGLERKVDGKWRRVKMSVTRDEGKYRLAVRPKLLGVARFRVSFFPYQDAPSAYGRVVKVRLVASEPDDPPCRQCAAR